MLTDEELKKLQRCELMIANEIKRICEDNNIKYFMVAGTVLGAVRHKGFIPWDDDMDFGMMRSEYEKFCAACIIELDDDFILQTWDTDPNYPFSFGKIRLKNTKIEELFASSKETLEKGIFVDVFPFDNVTDKENEVKSHARKYYFYKRAMWMKKGYGKNILTQNFKQKIKYIISSIVLSFVPYYLLKLRFEKTIMKYNHIETSRLVFDAPYKFENNCVDRVLIENLIDGIFEGYIYPMPSDYDAYLRHLYGDYMKLPDPDKRHSHDILSVDFGKYKEEKHA